LYVRKRRRRRRRRRRRKRRWWRRLGSVLRRKHTHPAKATV
jgi:hypothetical protein